MSIEDKLKSYVGGLIFEIHVLTERIEKLEAELKAKIETKEQPPAE